MSSFERQQSAGYMTNWAARLFARAIELKLKPLGLSSGQLPVFFALGSGRPMTQKALAKIAAVEQPTMANILSRMDRDGLISRIQDPDDGRSMLLSLTPAAQAKVPSVDAAIKEVNEMAIGNLSDDQKAMYFEVLSTIIAALDSSEDD